MTTVDIIEKLHVLADPHFAQGMKRFGINTESVLGVRIPDIRKLAKEIGKSHEQAQEIWKYPYNEAKILASLLADPALVNPELMESWIADVSSWEVCDSVCGNLFVKTPYAIEKALYWSESSELWVKRAGFVLMAQLAVHRKDVSDTQFLIFLEKIKKVQPDGRNFVFKAINWALRQIGKRNKFLFSHALAIAEALKKSSDKNIRWIGSNAISEFKNLSVSKNGV